MERETLELLLGEGWSVERIAERFGRHPSTVSYWMEKHGLQAVNRERHAGPDGLGREELQRLVGEGRSISEIAQAVDRSKATVRHWLGRYGLKTLNSVGAGARARGARAAREAGVLRITRSCEHHGEVEFVLEGRGYYRCTHCRTDAISRRRRKVKATLVAEAGGKCCICGYDRHPAALEFHHLDPLEKRLNVSASGVGLALDTLRAEARKCVLLCSNCHAEVENGAAELPLQLPRAVEAPIHLNPG